MLMLVLMLLATYLGLFSGVVISHFTKEEMATGKKYFLIGKAALFSVVLYFFLSHLALGWMLSLPASVFAGIIIYLWDRRIKYFNTDMVYYGFFSVAFYETKGVPLISVPIFLFGIFASSYKAEQQKEMGFLKIAKKQLADNLIYLVLVAGLFVFFR